MDIGRHGQIDCDRCCCWKTRILQLCAYRRPVYKSFSVYKILLLWSWRELVEVNRLYQYSPSCIVCLYSIVSSTNWRWWHSKSWPRRHHIISANWSGVTNHQDSFDHVVEFYLYKTESNVSLLTVLFVILYQLSGTACNKLLSLIWLLAFPHSSLVLKLSCTVERSDSDTRLFSTCDSLLCKRLKRAKQILQTI